MAKQYQQIRVERWLWEFMTTVIQRLEKSSGKNWTYTELIAMALQLVMNTPKLNDQIRLPIPGGKETLNKLGLTLEELEHLHPRKLEKTEPPAEYPEKKTPTSV